MLQVEGGVAGVLWGSLAVVAGTQLLRLDLSPLLGWLSTQRVLGHPGVSRSGLRAEPVAGGVRLATVGDRDPGVSMRRQVLVELVDVERLHVGDDVAAQLADVYGAEVDALLQRTAFTLQVRFAGRHICFGGCGRRGGTLGLTCFSKRRQEEIKKKEM